MGVLIEHCNGRFPLYFSPYQVALLPVGEESHRKRCEEIADQLRRSFRSDVKIDVMSTDL